MKGIDISNLNGSANIASVKNAGYGFVISKATEGHTFIDKYCSQNVTNTKANGLIAGAYHFARFIDVSGATQEANFFKQHCPSNVDFVVLDFEQQCSGDITNACLTFLDSISSIAPALIYCNPNYINIHLNSAITKYPLWIAHYGVSSPSTLRWANYAIWQYSESGKVNGVSGNVDLNISGADFNKILSRNNSFIPNGSIKQLQSLIGANPDGIVGRETLSKCPLLKVGNQNNVVKWLQYCLNSPSFVSAGISVDGIFGSGTKQAIQKYQSIRGIEADGIIGQGTWSKILGLS